ncbi:fibrinogen-like protein 1 [Drosophila busckii]|uniref:fibrinogen-like protein 1 n=1 Tax=Drosophila busckii TaxID=30019 RepID=UPI00083F0362|nr:fibrinogen-like protein 1 [Drosophila busckii]
MLSKDQLINEKNLRIIELQTALELKSKQLLEQAQAKQLEEKLSRYLEQRAAASCVPFENSTDVQTIRVPGIDPFKVSCDSSLIGSGWTVIQRRQDGSESFNREWSDYRAGFGNLRSEFFVGLEKLYLMTKTQPHELYIHLEDFQHNTRYARYTNFAIGSEEEAYKLESIGNYTGNAGDSMAYHLDYKFSTPDRDNDVNPTNCAKHFQSGWWFHKCYNCNLNGVYTMTDSKKDLDVLQWRTWHHKPLRFVQMMIRPKPA